MSDIAIRIDDHTRPGRVHRFAGRCSYPGRVGTRDYKLEIRFQVTVGADVMVIRLDIDEDERRIMQDLGIAAASEPGCGRLLSQIDAYVAPVIFEKLAATYGHLFDCCG